MLFGSGGGNVVGRFYAGGNGGGAIKLTVTDTLTLNGNITSNGGNGLNTIYYGYSGGGSGGSIWVTTNSITGTGALKAEGGNAISPAGSGGGGIIAVYYNSSSFDFSKSSVNNGAAGSVMGESGIINIINTGSNDLVILGGANFPDTAIYNYNTITVMGSAITIGGNATVNANSLILPSALTINAASGTKSIEFAQGTSPSGASKLVFNMTLPPSNLTFSRYNNVIFTEDSSISTQLANRRVITDRNLTINNPSLTQLYDSDISAANLNLDVSSVLSIQNSTISGNIDETFENLTIDSTSKISANYKGYPATQGPGAGDNSSWPSAGAGYGGKGGDANSGFWGSPKGGSSYGSALNPVDFGSGGGGGILAGSGGGAIKLIISDTLTINGIISSSGQNSSYAICGSGYTCGKGSGSGGSIWITTNIIKGSGSLHADGGNSNILVSHPGGGGGGGRIAVYYNINDGFDITNTTATGGIGYQRGEPGTMAFIDVDSNSLTIKDGFDFQQSPFEFNNIYVNNARLRTNVSSLIINVTGEMGIIGSNFNNSTVPLSIYAYTINFSNSVFNMSEINLFTYCNRLYENNVIYSPARNRAPNPAYETCGNGIREGCELCDDGNLDNDDGCSSICTLETMVSAWDAVIRPEGVYEPTAIGLQGTHLHTFEIRFTNVTALIGEALSCDIMTSDGSTLNVYRILTQPLDNENASINYTVSSLDASRIDKTRPWQIISCGKAASGTIYTHLNAWTQFDKEDDDAYRALDCWLGFKNRYFNNSVICDYEGDVAFAISMAKNLKVEGDCHDGIDNDGNGQIDCNDRYCQGIPYECNIHTPIVGGG